MVFLPHWPIPHGKKEIKLGLERVRELLNRLHNPEEKLPHVIHVAGTNGKGSTIAYLKAILEDAGYKVHRYISPHLVRFNERITLSGEEITDDFLYEITEQTRIAAQDLQTTFFEGTTAAALLAFSKVPADFLLLETGMGGKLDATNVIKKPMMSIITPISFDHTEFLGDTIEKIATEKAGIIKENSPCIISWQLKKAMNVFKKKCNELAVPSYKQGDDWDFEVTEDGFNFIDFETNTSYRLPHPSLIGIHQYINAATAAAASIKLNNAVNHKNISTGLMKTYWPGRMEKINKGILYDMLAEGFELWIDGAHNISGAQMIASHIENKWTDKPTYLINGRTANRDIKGFLSYFKGKVKCIYGIKIESEPLAESAKNIANEAKSVGFNAYECSSLKEAVSSIVKSNVPGRILACGSLYLAGDVLAANKK
jgi:dihydrofolate synthase / folylpolyglutamate synthase